MHFVFWMISLHKEAKKPQETGNESLTFHALIQEKRTESSCFSWHWKKPPLESEGLEVGCIPLCHSSKPTWLRILSGFALFRKSKLWEFISPISIVWRSDLFSLRLKTKRKSTARLPVPLDKRLDWQNVASVVSYSAPEALWSWWPACTIFPFKLNEVARAPIPLLAQYVVRPEIVFFFLNGSEITFKKSRWLGNDGLRWPTALTINT